MLGLAFGLVVGPKKELSSTVNSLVLDQLDIKHLPSSPPLFGLFLTYFLSIFAFDLSF